LILFSLLKKYISKKLLLSAKLFDKFIQFKLLKYINCIIIKNIKVKIKNIFILLLIIENISFEAILDT